MPATWCYEWSSTTDEFYKDRHARNSSWPGELLSTQRPNTFAQTYLLDQTFPLQSRGGPYIRNSLDIGHYGRLIFAMVARHFIGHDEHCAPLSKCPGSTAEEVEVMLRQVLLAASPNAKARRHLRAFSLKLVAGS